MVNKSHVAPDVSLCPNHRVGATMCHLADVFVNIVAQYSGRWRCCVDVVAPTPDRWRSWGAHWGIVLPVISIGDCFKGHATVIWLTFRQNQIDSVGPWDFSNNFVFYKISIPVTVQKLQAIQTDTQTDRQTDRHTKRSHKYAEATNKRSHGHRF